MKHATNQTPYRQRGLSVLGRYNSPVPSQPRENDVVPEHHRHNAYASETAGLLLIAIVLLVLTLVRYWHEIHWSWR